MLVHRPRIFQPGEAEAEGLGARVQPGLPRETVLGNRRLGVWFSDKGLAQGGQGPGCEMGEGKEDELQDSVSPKARRSIPLERAVSLAHSCREVKSGDSVGLPPSWSKRHWPWSVMLYSSFQAQRKGREVGVGDLLYL